MSLVMNFTDSFQKTCCRSLRHKKNILSGQPWPEAAVLPDVLQIKFSWKFCNIHLKTPVLESLFNKIAGLKVCNLIIKRLQDSYLPENIAKSLRTAIFIEQLGWLILPDIKDTLKAFGDFKNKQKTVWLNFFLICKSMVILKVYSIHYTLR